MIIIKNIFVSGMMKNSFVFSIRSKLIILFAVVIIMTSLSVSIAFYRTSRATIQNQAEIMAAITLEQTVSRFDMFMENIHRATLSIAFNRDLKKLLIESVWGNEDQFNNLLRITDLISTFNNTNRFVYMMEIYDFHNRIILTSRGGRRSIDPEAAEYQLIHNLYFNTAERNTSTYQWSPSRNVTFNNVSKNVFTLSMPVRDDYTGEVIAVVMTYVPDEFITLMCREVSANAGATYIIDDARTVLFSSDASSFGQQLQLNENVLQEGSQVRKKDGQPFLYTVKKSSYLDWSFVSVVPIHLMMKDQTNVLRTSIVFISIFTVLLTVVLAAAMNRLFYNPVKKLIRQIKLDGLDKNADVELFSRKDEIGFVFRSFKNILNSNRELLENNYQQKIYMRDAEIRLLFSQMNPHFLYNSLDAILWMLSFGQYDQIKVMVKAMIAFFRLSLNKGKEIIDVRSAKEQIENYFIIQQLRYSDRLTVAIEFDDAILDLKMLNLLLQPVVENAIYHGIEKKPGQALIRIQGGRQNGDLIFIVEDNGVGVSPSRLAEINAIIHSDQQPDEGFFALQNVNRRIQLYYGEAYGIQLESAEGHGVRVQIRIPIKR